MYILIYVYLYIFIHIYYHMFIGFWIMFYGVVGQNISLTLIFLMKRKLNFLHGPYSVNVLDPFSIRPTRALGGSWFPIFQYGEHPN